MLDFHVRAAEESVVQQRGELKWQSHGGAENLHARVYFFAADEYFENDSLPAHRSIELANVWIDGSDRAALFRVHPAKRFRAPRLVD